MKKPAITMAYTLKEGDTLALLMERYGISEDDFYAENPGKLLFTPGRQVRIPVRWRICPHGLLYPLERGDTLASAAARFGMTLFELLCLNPHLAPWDCTPGRVIIVQNKGGTGRG